MQTRVVSVLPRAPRVFPIWRSFACSCDSPAMDPLEPPVPGTVKDYVGHIMLKLPRPTESPGGAGAWWPPQVERQVISDLFPSPILAYLFKLSIRSNI